MSKPAPAIPRLTRGAKKLRSLLQRRKLTITDFAKSAGVDRIQLHRVLTGERWKHISVDFALGVRDATGGAIDVEDFASMTATDVVDEDVEPRRKATGSYG